MRPSQTFHVLEELVGFPQAPLTRKGVRLSVDDSLIVFEVYQQWILLMLDIGYLAPDTFIRDARRLLTDMLAADVFELNDAFAECLDCVYNQTSQGFKVRCGKVSKHLYALIKADWMRCLQDDPFSGQRLIQAFAYTSRLSLRDVDLTQQQLEDYLSTEENILWDDRNLPLANRLNSYIKTWLGKTLDMEITPHHGPGGVAKLGRCSIEAKFKDLTSDQLISYCFHDPVVVSQNPSLLDRTSQTIFVAKSYKSFRTISMEPATLQYYQQGLQRAVQSIVERSPYLKNHIGLRDQTRNQKLAREGSVMRNYATIDLSAASDSVSYELVKHLFKGTWLYRYLVGTRSNRTILPNGDVITLKKFAPMGSSLCFPVETFVFAAICEHVTRICGVPSDYSVYGDDIVVPTHCVESLLDILTRLGFKVNRTKSFSLKSCWFRESCGGNYLSGVDVTPLRVSRRYSSRDRQEAFTSLIDLANRSFDYNYTNLRHYFIMKIRRLKIKPLFAPTSLKARSYTNYHLRKRWNASLQRIEVRCHHISSKQTDKTVSDEAIRYLNWLNETYERKRLRDAFESVVGDCHAVVSYGWAAKPFEEFDQPFIDTQLRRD